MKVLITKRQRVYQTVTIEAEVPDDMDRDDWYEWARDNFDDLEKIADAAGAVDVSEDCSNPEFEVEED